ncbi:metal-dependent hydrolase family protein [Vibrio hangzhouensis]|uniref:metal-dependent hydrolase family protein n=1 Tax=Vibrio hangzhouensis TaxID=462991 RepID=UPI001C988E17|nr:amidohydrolase family protein [Vibrio hangzhouensis]MBY6197734.1 amidohydrolase family protein [Vibrio hangzhouensis]
MKKITLKVSLLAVSLSASMFASASTTIFSNVDIFNGTENKLYEDHHVLIEGNKITKISSSAISADGATVIDGQGKTLMPGLIDAHTHMNLNVVGGVGGLEHATWDKIGARAAYMAQEYLAMGFTSVREMGGSGSGLKETIDDGLIEGPRIYPSGAILTQTSGHGDLRSRSQRNPVLTPYVDSNAERLGLTITADGADRMLAAARQNFSQGASQLKIMAGGGVASILDPLHTLQFTPREIEAAVAAADDWDTYVAAHVFSDEGINRCIDAGVKSIEHGFFASKETMQKMKDNDVYLVAQVTGISPYLQQLPALQAGPNKAKLAKATTLSQDFVQNVKEIQPKFVFQTDAVFNTGPALRSQVDYEKWFHAELFGNFEMLRASTSTAGELLALSGESNPYPGKLGVVEVDAYADLLLVDGNPLEDISVIGGNSKWFDAKPRDKDIKTIKIIMKDGVIYKNTL